MIYLVMNWSAETWVSVVAAVVAVVGAVTTVRQTRIAKNAAVSADRQALAAEEQVALSRREYEERRAESDEASGPIFTVTEVHLETHGEFFARIKIQMVSGQPVRTVKITARGKDVRSLAQSLGDYDRLEEQIWTDVAQGAVVEVIAHLEWHHDTPTNVTLDLVCEEAAGQHRRWLRSVTAAAVEPPPPPTKLGQSRYGL